LLATYLRSPALLGRARGLPEVAVEVELEVA
jgi:hypothetical protein